MSVDQLHRYGKHSLRFRNIYWVTDMSNPIQNYDIVNETVVIVKLSHHKDQLVQDVGHIFFERVIKGTKILEEIKRM